jgi:hypothetical protein
MSEEDRDKVVTDLLPQHWDRTAYDLMLKIRDLAATLPGVRITGSGTGDGNADFSVELNDNSYWINVNWIGPKPS